MADASLLREHLVKLLDGGQAYETFEEITAAFAPEQRGEVVPGSERSAWQILEHLRIAQRDLLDFSLNQDGRYVERKWPEEYWPAAAAPPDPGAWDRSVRAFQADRAEIQALVQNPAADLFTPFPWGKGQTLLREVLVAAEHAGYHLGQLVLLRRLLEG